MERHVTIVGGGLAGSEAAWQVARLGVPVRLIEMRPKKSTPAHTTGLLAELVCSNSLGSVRLESAAGILKKELEILHSLVMKTAYDHRLPAGDALAVDRESFSSSITDTINNHPLIRVIKDEVSQFVDIKGPLIIATGPLTTETLSDRIKEYIGEDSLYFYDAVAPIVYAESVDQSKGFWGSRWRSETGDYFNCTLSKNEYDRFYQALLEANSSSPHIDEDLLVFEGCMPIEEIARRGYKTLLFGPMRSKGMRDPSTGKRPFAILQLRQENKSGTLLGLVGFQTRLKWGDQKRVFSLIPALQNAEYARFGVMHRNSFLNAPKVLLPTYQSRKREDLFFAGQLSGVEGYLESVASGIIAGINAARMVLNKNLVIPPKESMIGALSHFITSAEPSNFQPMNANYGLLPSQGEGRMKKIEHRYLQMEKAIQSIKNWTESLPQI